MSKITKQDQEEARATLRQLCPAGTVVYTVLRHVSRSGMSRGIDCYVMHEGAPRWISYLVARATGESFDEQRECVKVSGCGMDMGFYLVYNLSAVLFRDGFACCGEGCGSCDHANPPHPPRVADGMHHEDGGYALRHRWM